MKCRECGEAVNPDKISLARLLEPERCSRCAAQKLIPEKNSGADFEKNRDQIVGRLVRKLYGSERE